MIDFVEIDGPSVKAKRSMHESGQQMIVFMPFRPSLLAAHIVDELINAARSKLGGDLKVTRICLGPDQKTEKTLLEQMGFAQDGIEYGIEIEKLKEALPLGRSGLPEDLEIRAMEYDLDIDAVVRLEKVVHAADQSSRVNFETAEAVEGMKGYYKKACGGKGVYLLLQGERVIGLVGFMPDKEHEGAVHISSVSIALDLQGKGLLFPFILESLRRSRFADFKSITGVTTTAKLIEAAKRYSVNIIGMSLSRMA